MGSAGSPSALLHDLNNLLAINVETRLCDELWPVYVDPGQLQTALLNLCLNARDAMGTSGRLLIETTNVNVTKGSLEGIPRGRWVMIKVTDTGVGMEPGVLEKSVSAILHHKESRQR